MRKQRIVVAFIIRLSGIFFFLPLISCIIICFPYVAEGELLRVLQAKFLTLPIIGGVGVELADEDTK